MQQFLKCITWGLLYVARSTALCLATWRNTRVQNSRKVVWFIKDVWNCTEKLLFIFTMWGWVLRLTLWPHYPKEKRYILVVVKRRVGLLSMSGICEKFNTTATVNQI